MSELTAAYRKSLRELRSAIELKGLSLTDVSVRSTVNYTECSNILAGRVIHAEKLAKIRAAIEAAPMPKEVAR